MATRHADTLILGGGFGGIAVATGLREAVGKDHEIVVVDRAPRFSMGLRKLWELVGIGTIADGSRPRALLEGNGVDFVRTEIRAIDPSSRTVETEAGTMSGERVVIALGAAQRPDLVPGLAEHGHDVWSVAAIEDAATALGRFDGGRILILVAGAPYSCPPAPYECAFLVDEYLSSRGLRAASSIDVATVQPMLMPNAGRDGSDWMAAQLTQRGIGHQAGVAISHVEAGHVVLADGGLPFDLLFAVPPHRPPAVLTDSGLLGEHGWVAVDARTLETAFEGVYAVGDCTMIRLANGLPMPKAGLVAELEGDRVARAIAAQVRGDPPAAPFDGAGECFIEMGAEQAAMFSGRFFEEPAPQISIREPTPDHAAKKRAFEAERLAKWFGR